MKPQPDTGPGVWTEVERRHANYVSAASVRADRDRGRRGNTVDDRQPSAVLAAGRWLAWELADLNMDSSAQRHNASGN
ncbi:MAG: hypothetical protein ACR2KV_14655 [Solirubrobacteraceae bacterium]